MKLLVLLWAFFALNVVCAIVNAALGTYTVAAANAAVAAALLHWLVFLHRRRSWRRWTSLTDRARLDEFNRWRRP